MVERLEVADQFVSEGHKVSQVIGFSDIASSTWYSQKNKSLNDRRRQNKGRPIPGYTVNPDGLIILDSIIVAALKKLRNLKEFVNAGGCQKLRHYLRRQYGFVVNEKKVYRLCKEHGLLLPKRKKRKRNQTPISRNRIITGPNQLWEIDLKYGYIHGENRFFFILAIIDVYSRQIVNYHIGLRCQGKDLIFILQVAQHRYQSEGDGLIIRTDRGTQMTSNAFCKYVADQGEESLIHELIPPATPNKNAHIESFNSILELECFQVRYFRSYGQAYEETVEFIDKYNTERIHGSLGFKTPQEIYEMYQNGEKLELKEVRV